MILSARDLADGHVLRGDICIVGAGAAGIAMALELIESGLEVLVLESGGLEFDPQTQSLYKGDVADERMHSQPERFRQRQFGGSTTIWGGRCMPFDAIDFERREYVPHSGWPFGLDELIPFYLKANRICEAGEFAYTAAEAFSSSIRPMIEGFRSKHFTTEGLERFSCPTNFGTRYLHKLKEATTVRIVLHANVTRISLNDAADRVNSLRVQTLGGTSFRVEAKDFVLATGGLEVPRLLLSSRDKNPMGIGNEYDLVGRYYMCHMAGTIGALRFSGHPSSIHHGYDMSEEGIYCRRRISILPEVQRSQRLGNFVVRLHHPRIPDPAHSNSVLSLLFLARIFIPYEYAKRLHGTDKISLRQWLQHFANIARRPFDAFAFAWHMLRDRKLAERKFPSVIIRSRANLYSLDFHAEQLPNPESRIRLSDSVDVFGMPRILVDWRYTPADVDTVRRAIAMLAADLESSGVGRLDYDPGLVEMEMTRYGAYDGHHIGTARMGVDPRISVVDPNCRVHGIKNLFIASSAVFPTSSQANPTLTIVALALRLASHLIAAQSSNAVSKPSPASTCDAQN